MAQKRGDDYKFQLLEYSRKIMEDAVTIGYRSPGPNYADSVLELANKIHNWIQEDFSPAKSKGDDETK
jgi:hypothetical protein